MFKKKEKKVVSLQDFYTAVGEVANEIGQTYYQVSVKICNGRLTFTGYVHGLSHLDGITIEEVCEKN